MGMLDVVDTIVAAVTVPTGTTRDGTGARPAEYEPDTLYGWSVSDRRAVEGDGTVDDSRFQVILALTVASAEDADTGRDRTVSETLDDAADVIAEWVREHRANELWHHLQVDAIDFDALHGFDYRAVRITLSGMREVQG